MASLASINVKFIADLKQFSTQMQNASRQMQRQGKKLQRLGKSMSMGLTLPLTAFAGVSTKIFADFEQGMAKVKAVSGANAKEFQNLTNNAKKLGATTRFTASQVSELQLNYSKLGFAASEITKVTGATLDLSLASGEDLAESATVAASTLRGFGIEAENMDRVVNVMAKSFSSSALDLEKFKTAMGQLAPVAKSAGVSLEQATSFLSILVDRGVDASTAGTGLRNMFLTLAKKGLTLTEALTQIQTSLDKNATSVELFGARGAVVATIMAENVEEAQKLEKAYINSAGAASEMAKIMDNTLQGTLFKLKSAFEGLSIEVGEVLKPLVSALAETLADLATWFTNLSPSAKKLIVVIGGIAATIGPLIATIGFFMTTILPALTAGIASLKVVMVALTGPIGLIIAGIVAIGVAVYKNWEPVKQTLVDIGNYFIDLYNESMGFRIAVNYVTTSFKNMWAVAKFVFNTLYNVLKAFVGDIVNRFKLLGGVIKGAFTLDFSAIKKSFQEFRKNGVETFSKAFKEIGNDAKILGNTLSENIIGAIENVSKKTKLKLTAENVDTKEVVKEIVKNTTGGTPTKKTVTNVNAETKEANPVQKMVDNLKAIKPQLQAELISMSDMMIEFNLGINEILNNTAQGFLVGFGEILGAMASGTAGASDLIGMALETMASMLIQLGKLAIQTGVAIAGIKKALASLNPIVAIAAGVALVGLGTLIKGQISNLASSKGSTPTPFANGGIVYGATNALIGEYANARTNPEVVAPLSKLKELIKPQNSGNVTVDLAGNFRLNGQDLILAVDRATNRKNRIS